MVIKVYIDYMSQPARAVVCLLKLAKIPYQVELVGIFKGQNKSKEYLKINPYGQIPAIIDTNFNDFSLSESLAIMQYLCLQYRNTATELLYPSDLQQKAVVDKFCHWYHSNLRTACLYPLYNVFIGSKTGQKLFDKDTFLMFQQMQKRSFAFLDKILKNQKYLTGDQLTIADLICVSEIAQIKMFDYSDFKEQFGYSYVVPKSVQNWIDRVLSIQEVSEVFQVFNKVINSLSKKYSAKL